MTVFENMSCNCRKYFLHRNIRFLRTNFFLAPFFRAIKANRDVSRDSPSKANLCLGFFFILNRVYCNSRDVRRLLFPESFLRDAV